MSNLQINRLRTLAMAKSLEDSFKSWLKFMCAAVSSNAELSLPSKSVINKWYKESLPFISSYNKKRFDLIYKYIFKHSSKWEDRLNRMGNEIKNSILPSLMSDSEISSDYLDLLSALGIYFRNFSDSSFDRIMKKSNILGDMNVNKSFTYEVDQTQNQAIRKAKQLAEKLMGKGADPLISGADKKELKKKYAKNEKMLDLIKQQTKAYTEVKNIYKKHLANIVRSSGKPYLPVSLVLRELKKRGIVKHDIPKNYVGNIDDAGNLYTVRGKKLQSSPRNFSVVMNPDYDPDKDNTYVCSSDGDGNFKTFQRYYTVDHWTKSRTKKFDLVEKADAVIDDVREKWLKNLHRWTGDAKNVASLEMEIMYNVQSRIGNPGSKTDGKTTYATSTWKVSHIKFDGNKATIKYIGKKGQPQKHVLDPSKFPEHRLIVDRLKKLVKGKGSREYVFTDNTGKRVPESYVNQQLREYGFPENAGAHKLRHIKGTRMAKEIFSKTPFDKRKTPPKQNEVDKWVKTSIEKIGKQLGHQVTKPDGTKKVQWSTAMNSYIRPEVVKDFYNRIGVHIPKFLEKLKTED